MKDYTKWPRGRGQRLQLMKRMTEYIRLNNEILGKEMTSKKDCEDHYENTQKAGQLWSEMLPLEKAYLPGSIMWCQCRMEVEHSSDKTGGSVEMVNMGPDYAELWLARHGGYLEKYGCLCVKCREKAGFPTEYIKRSDWKERVNPDYCTQNDGDCGTCSLVNYTRDCRNNRIGSHHDNKHLHLHKCG